MGDWGGAPSGWVPPEDRKEVAAAEAAAAKMNADRQAAEDNTAAIVATIDKGFATLSAAIMVAAGVSDEAMRAFWHPDEEPAPGLDAPYTGPLMHAPNPIFPPVPADMPDPDIDDLITEDGECVDCGALAGYDHLPSCCAPDPERPGHYRDCVDNCTSDHK